ncbi:hypothetical protein V6N12_057254 [Hibiscus sabdariffa]|uniref:Uncharacterized protein n=1 Tax=Hibiscus sabdariffa TaxID=183260 RepID=A0ABR2DBD3_9ROSI
MHREVREFMKKICSRFAAYQGTQCKFFTTLPPDFGFRIWIAGWDFNFIIPLRLVFAYHVPTVVSEPLVRSEFGLNTFLMRYVLITPIDDKDEFEKLMDDMVDVGCLMLATMNPELQKQHEDMVAYEMIQKSQGDL